MSYFTLKDPIVAEIIDDIIDGACVNAECNDTITETNEAVGEQLLMVSSDGNASGDESDRVAVEMQATETGNEEDDVESNFDEEMVSMAEFNALECQQTNEGDKRNDIDEKMVSNAEIGSDNNRKCESGAEDGLGNVEKTLEVESTPSDNLRLKGFSIKTFGRSLIVISMPLMVVKSTLNLCEIRCERFPLKMMENELMPIFENFGRVFKLSKNTVSNVIVVTYTNSKDAEKAIKSLNRSNIHGQMVLVSKRLANERLIVKPIPRWVTKKELLSIFGNVTRDLQSVSLYNDPNNENKNRGFCYLDYESEAKAISAKKILSSKMFFGTQLNVEWPNRRYDWVETRDTLYITNLRSSVRCEDLKRLFSVYGELVDVCRIGKYCKILFRNADDAIRAAREIDKSHLGNENVEFSFVELTWAKRRERREPPKKELGLSDTLYITNVSSLLSQSDLLKIFRFYGDVVNISKNENFVSIRFRNSEESKRAARCIDKNQLGIDVQISFRESSFKKKPTKPSDTLFVTNLGSGIIASDLRECFSVYGEVMEIDKTGDFASVRFRDSENAKRAAHDIDKSSLGNNVEVSLTNPKQKKVPEVSDTLYINNLNADMKASRLMQLFSVYGEVIAVDKNDDTAAVQFRNSQSSKRAAQEINRKHLGEANVEISFLPKMP